MAKADGLLDMDRGGKLAVAAEGEAAGPEGAGEVDSGDQDQATDAVATKVFGHGILANSNSPSCSGMRVQRPTGRSPAKGIRICATEIL